MIAARWDEREYGPQTVAPMSALHVSFQRVWPWLKKAIAAYGPTHRKRHVWRRIETEAAQLWTNEHSAIVTTIDVWPSGFKELTGWLSAGDLNGVLELRPVIEAWAKAKGCDRVSLSGRHGWVRAFPDYRHITSTLVKDL